MIELIIIYIDDTQRDGPLSKTKTVNKLNFTKLKLPRHSVKQLCINFILKIPTDSLVANTWRQTDGCGLQNRRFGLPPGPL